MSAKRTFTPEFKARVVLELLTRTKSVAEASREYGVPEPVLSQWERVFVERAPLLFETAGQEAVGQSGADTASSQQATADDTAPDALAFSESLERSLRENREIWQELAKH